MKNSHSESYAAAGVDVTAGYEAVNRIKPLVESTYIPGVMGTLGGFGGLFAPDTAGMKKPVLVSGTDGVGTKLKIAFLMDKHDTVGIDCVAMCVNDIVCAGAMPLFFLDYLAVGKNLPERVEAIVSGVTEGCRQAGWWIRKTCSPAAPSRRGICSSVWAPPASTPTASLWFERCWASTAGKRWRSMCPSWAAPWARSSSSPPAFTCGPSAASSSTAWRSRR